MHRFFQQYSPNEEPPSYYDIEQNPKATKTTEEAATAESEVAPPSYTTYLQQIRQPVEQITSFVTVSESEPNRVEKFILIFALLLNAVILPIGMVIVGYSSFNQCDTQPRLPVLLVLYGLAKFLFYFGYLFDFIIKLINKNVVIRRSGTRKFVSYILFGLVFICFLNGNIFAYKPTSDLKACLAQLFLFWYITAVWAIIGLILIACIFVNCFPKKCTNSSL